VFFLQGVEEFAVHPGFIILDIGFAFLVSQFLQEGVVFLYRFKCLPGK
jgi:hypothetical protein